MKKTALIKKIFFTTCLFLFWFAPSLSFGHDLQISQSLKQATKGDYVVSAQGKNFTLFHVIDREENLLSVEEISAPLTLKKTINSCWQKWVNQGAPGHISWVVYELDLHRCQIDQMYSYSQRSWRQIYPQEQIFPTLISLSFKEITENQRKKTGPRPPLDVPDTRKIWNPPIFADGKKIKTAQCKAFQATWPQDDTELSGKKIEVYIPSDSGSQLPSYFPFWVQVSNNFAQAKMRVIDSGKNLQTPYQKIPLPPLELVSQHYSSDGGLIFDIKAHPKLTELNVYIREKDEIKCQTIDYKMNKKGSERQISILIDPKSIHKHFKADKVYYFIFEPIYQPHLSVETIKPLGSLKPHAHSSVDR